MEEEIRETKFLLNEDRFSQLCKVGYIRYQSTEGSQDIHFYKPDILSLVNGECVDKILEQEVLKFMVVTLDRETFREIVKRSPIFYELSNQI